MEDYNFREVSHKEGHLCTSRGMRGCPGSKCSRGHIEMGGATRHRLGTENADQDESGYPLPRQMSGRSNRKK